MYATKMLIGFTEGLQWAAWMDEKWAFVFLLER